MPGPVEPDDPDPVLRRRTARASSGICRRAPGVPCIQTIAGPRREPYSAKLSRRPPRTATVPSRAGRFDVRSCRSSVPRQAEPDGDGSTMFSRSRTAPSSRPSPTTTGPSTTSSTTQVMLSLPPASSAELGQHRRRGVRVGQPEHLGDPLVVDQVGQPVAAEQQPVALRGRRGRTRSGSPAPSSGRRRGSGARRCATGDRCARSALELPGVDEVLDVGVVVGDLAQRRRRGTGRRDCRRRARGTTRSPSQTTTVSVVAIPSPLEVLLHTGAQADPRVADRGPDHRCRVVPEPRQGGRGDDVRRGRGGDLTRGRTADTVGDQRDVGPDRRRSPRCAGGPARRH